MRRIRKSVARVKSIAWLIWHTKHELTHVLLGLVWAWYLRELWGEFNPRWIWLSVVASLLPDIDHILYFFTYGRKDAFSVQTRYYLRHFQIRNLWTLWENGHKHNTGLATHNMFTVGTLFAIGTASWFYEWQTAVVFFGAMFFHYAFDIIDDLLILGSLNSNWKRLGRSRFLPSKNR